MFAAFIYGIIFASIVALNHKFAQPYDDVRNAREKRHERRRQRYDKNRAAEKQEYEKRKQKRREARKKQREEEQRKRELGQGERRWFYGKPLAARGVPM